MVLGGLGSVGGGDGGWVVVVVVVVVAGGRGARDLTRFSSPKFVFSEDLRGGRAGGGGGAGRLMT